MADENTKGAADQVDVLAENTKLTARVTELEGQLSDASTKVDALTKEYAALKADNEKLKAELDANKAKEVDANKLAADIVAKIGIVNPKAEQKPETQKAKTYTELCIEAIAASKQAV